MTCPTFQFSDHLGLGLSTLLAAVALAARLLAAILACTVGPLLLHLLSVLLWIGRRGGGWDDGDAVHALWRRHGLPCLPGGRPAPFMRHVRWRESLFMHWEVDPAVLARLLPEGLQPDLSFDGKAYVGLVLLSEEGVAPALPRQWGCCRRLEQAVGISHDVRAVRCADRQTSQTHRHTHTHTDTDTHTHTHAHTTAITRPPPNPDTSIVHRILQSTRCPITRDINVCWRPQPYFVELSPPRTI